MGTSGRVCRCVWLPRQLEVAVERLHCTDELKQHEQRAFQRHLVHASCASCTCCPWPASPTPCGCAARAWTRSATASSWSCARRATAHLPRLERGQGHGVAGEERMAYEVVTAVDFLRCWPPSPGPHPAPRHQVAQLFARRPAAHQGGRLRPLKAAGGRPRSLHVLAEGHRRHAAVNDP